MRSSTRCAISTLVFFLSSTALSGQAPKAGVPDGARLAAARQVLQAGGTAETMLAAMRANLPAQRMANPAVPAEFWTRFEARLVNDLPQLVDSIAVLYAGKLRNQSSRRCSRSIGHRPAVASANFSRRS
jgi:hypothetical protein